MKKLINRTLAAVALTAALGTASTTALAYPIFTVTESPALIPNTLQNSFQADRIYGSYLEVISFTPTALDGTAGTFDASLKWDAGQFVTSGSNVNAPSQLGSVTANQYGLYALYQASGTFLTVGQETVFTFTSGGTLNVFLDPQSNTRMTQPADGSTAFAYENGTGLDDILIATGMAIAGEGNLDRSLSTCPAPGTPNTSGINCGSFGATSTFALTEAGSQYFTGPQPFYNLSYQSGQLNNVSPNAVQVINGSLDVVFGNAVPEPASVALIGLGMLGLGLSRRRKTAK